MRKLFNDIITGKDNKTTDLGRVSLLFSLVMYNIFFTVKIIYTHDFDAVIYVSGLGLLLTGHGGFIALKKDTEPTAADSLKLGERHDIG